MEELVHIGTVKDGAIIKLKGNHHICMKVCDKNGKGGIVHLVGGLYTSTQDLLSPFCIVIAENLDEFYYQKEEEEAEIARLAWR